MTPPPVAIEAIEKVTVVAEPVILPPVEIAMVAAAMLSQVSIKSDNISKKRTQENIS